MPCLFREEKALQTTAAFQKPIDGKKETTFGIANGLCTIPQGLPVSKMKRFSLANDSYLVGRGPAFPVQKPNTSPVITWTPFPSAYCHQLSKKTKQKTVK